MTEIRIDGERLWKSLMDMAKIGATDQGGVCRLARTDIDKAARDLFVKWCEEAGGTVTNYSGERFDPFGRQCVATNGVIHPLLLDAISKHWPPACPSCNPVTAHFRNSWRSPAAAVCSSPAIRQLSPINCSVCSTTPSCESP